MSLPFFYKESIDANAADIVLDENTSKHIVQVLRMENGEALQLTDGKGHIYTTSIKDNNRKKCVVSVTGTTVVPAVNNKVSIAISFVKSNSRFEWFLEKATEIGVAQIIPLICERTEKTAFKEDRLKGILVSAMLQSQQAWLPVLTEPVRFSKLVSSSSNPKQKLIAHCEDEASKQQLTSIATKEDAIILIGPEGDFTKEEITLALQNNFVPVSLGNTRLRTETAGIVAATLLCI